MFEMSALKIIFFVSVAVSVAKGMTERCTNHGFSYRSSRQFHSEKQDGRHYKCTCSGYDCRTIQCVMLSGPTQAPPSTNEDDTIIGGVPVDTSLRPLRPIGGESGSTLARRGYCYDIKAPRREVLYGNYYFRYGVRDGRSVATEYCLCSSNGAVTCSPTGSCPVFPTPTDSSAGRGDYYSLDCYDEWMRKTYRNGERYQRNKTMADGIYGIYSCTCRNAFMRCYAQDIPCCDITTQRYMDMNQTFVVSLGRAAMRCTCKRARGSFRNCYPATSTTTARPVRPVPTSNRECIDPYTGSRHSPRRNWIRKTGSTFYECRCLVDSRRNRPPFISCRRMYG